MREILYRIHNPTICWEGINTWVTKSSEYSPSEDMRNTVRYNFSSSCQSEVRWWRRIPRRLLVSPFFYIIAGENCYYHPNVVYIFYGLLVTLGHDDFLTDPEQLSDKAIYLKVFEPLLDTSFLSRIVWVTHRIFFFHPVNSLDHFWPFNFTFFFPGKDYVMFSSLLFFCCVLWDTCI